MHLMQSVLQRMPLSGELFFLYLHQNYLSFLEDLDDLSAVADAFSFADGLTRHYTVSELSSFQCFSVLPCFILDSSLLPFSHLLFSHYCRLCSFPITELPPILIHWCPLPLTNATARTSPSGWLVGWL